MKVKIYCLIDPVTFKIRYIGRTKNSLSTRLQGHLTKSKLKKTHRDYWIQSLMRNGRIPIIKTITVCNGWKESHDMERRYISIGIKYKFPLTNHDDRGEGEKNKKITAKQRKQISETLKRKYKTGEIKPTKTTPVFVFDLKGIFLQKFNSIADCCIVLNLKVSSVEKVLSGKAKRNKNYQITYGKNPGKYVGRDAKKASEKLKKPVVLIKGNEKIKFSSYKDAAGFLNVTTPTIRRHLNKQYKNYFIKPMPV